MRKELPRRAGEAPAAARCRAAVEERRDRRVARIQARIGIARIQARLGMSRIARRARWFWWLGRGGSVARRGRPGRSPLLRDEHPPDLQGGELRRALPQRPRPPRAAAAARRGCCLISHRLPIARCSLLRPAYRINHLPWIPCPEACPDHDIARRSLRRLPVFVPGGLAHLIHAAGRASVWSVRSRDLQARSVHAISMPKQPGWKRQPRASGQLIPRVNGRRVHLFAWIWICQEV